MSSTFTTCRTALQTGARTVVPFITTPSQVVLGTYNWAAGTDFFANIITSGPWLFIKPTAGNASGQTFNGDFIVKADLVYGFAGNAAYTWTAPDDIIALLITAWTTASEFVKGGVLGPFELAWEEPEQLDDLEGVAVVARTKFTFTFKFVAG